MPRFRRISAALGVAGTIVLVSCLPGERAVHIEVVNTCAQNVNVRLAYNEGALATARPKEVAAGQTGVIEAIYPGPSTPLILAVSRAADDQPRVVLPARRADDHDALRLMLPESVCSEIQPN